MKKTFIIPFLMVAFVLGLVSCQREEIGSVSGKSFKITAEIQDISTRITYDVDNAKNTITPQWTVDDTIIGFDNNGEKFTFTVTGVDPTTKKAIFDKGEYNPGTATKLYAIYYPGKTIGNIVDDSLSVNLSAQSGAALGNNSPVLMCATADIENEEVNLMFSHQSAVVGIKRCKIGADEIINSVKVSGLVTSGTFKVVNEEMVLVASTETSDITVGDLEITADADGIVGTSTTPAFMFATLPKADAQISIEATTTSSAQYVTLTNLTGNIEKGNYYYADKKLTTDVAAIGNISYGTLSSAFNAASGTATIKILNDCEADATLTVASGKTVTLDLNGKTVTISGNNTADPKVANRIEVVEGGDLTITDNSSDVVASQGSIVAADGTKGTSNVVAIGGKLTIAGGNIISDPANSDDIDAAVYGKAGATVTVTGGYIRGEGAEGALSVNSSTDDITAGKVCSLTITGGKLEYSASKTKTLSTLYIYRSNATISGGHILNSYTEKNGGAAIYADNNNNTKAQVSVTVSGDANVEGNAQYGVRSRYGMPVNISGGRVSARKPLVAEDGAATCTVSGGELYNTAAGWQVLTVADGATIAVTGGKLYATSTTNLTSVSGTGSNIEFSGSVISNKAFLNNRVNDGWVVDRNVDSENPKYVFKLAQEDNSITATDDSGEYHCTPAGAEQYVNNSSLAVTLTVQQNFSTSKLDFYAGRDNLITLNLNGKTISNKADNQNYLIVSSSSLTIEDSSNPSTGALNGGHCAVYADSSAVLTINGGSFSGDGKKDNGNGVVYATSTADSLIIEGGTITCSASENGDYRAVNFGCDGKMTGGKIVSKGSCLRTTGNGANFTVDGEDDDINIISDNDAYNTMIIASSNSEIKIKAGHYFISGPSQPGDSVAFQNDANRVVVTGGKMNVGSNKVTAATGYKVSALDPTETFDGKTYLYKVEEDTEAEPVASVNGTNYSSLSDAYTAAMAISDSVTIKLLADATITGRWDFNKQGTAGTCLDLNGRTISTTIDSVFTPMKPLTITDSNSGTKGTITSSKYCVLALNKDAYTTVNINNCTITSTSTATDVGKSLIRSYNSSSINASKRIINIGENAKIIANRNAIYACYGTVNISSNAEITAKDNNTNASAIYVYTGGKVNVSDNASLKGYNVFRSGTGANATAVTINGGYFYAAGENGKILNANTASDKKYDGRFNFEGGYYNKAVDKTLYPNATIKAATTAITPVSHSHGGESLSYGYQIQ